MDVAPVKAAIMQPYFFPYIGYFQLIQAVDLFVIYDDVKYTKKGWINRNRFLRNGQDAFFTIPLRKDSNELHIGSRALASDFKKDKLLNQISGAYRNAPYFGPAYGLFESVVRNDEWNLFKFVWRSIVEACNYLGIKTKIAVSSTFETDPMLRHRDRVIALCKSAGAGTYVNPIGGQALYSNDDFASEGLALKFLKPKPFEYRQFGGEFVPWLSIIDVIMFNPKDVIAERLSHGFELI